VCIKKLSVFLGYPAVCIENVLNNRDSQRFLLQM
jgi:hypothetical protein